MEAKADELLRRNQLSVTNGRRKILDLFLRQEGALSHSDIEKRAAEKFDRVTVYRTLQAFLEKGLIHTIPTADNSIRYALCREHCAEGQHRDDHVHFVCRTCGNTVCLEEVSIPSIRLPRGFVTTQVEMVVSGTCKNCSE
ncbi:MAG: Fur family transcriptional regulator [Bacteroidota bacterium]|nr:Fur family transcriptional regulator [Bacteroidota bacterium]MDP4214668.1 Fur family transcriptional regulator [Bacteroidota bacterium]MDP4244361.1 Fur family transcriptional regulator [Bacteroidota bacterium]MDP4255700.1 Fur family transcriptional regulator [Bacteroidota bacterium]MDP4258923.1 Fur family transcriptional regulator [Bacteroidota bacterium]